MAIARSPKAAKKSPAPAVTAFRTPDELYLEGRALRDKVSRASHAGWTAPSRRQDVVRNLEASNHDRVPELIPIRYGRMLQSPFTFYRGAASVMAADLAHTPASGIIVQACGDCHLLNFGGYATPERRLIFSINDFDETARAPWEWDVKRLAASFVVGGRSTGFSAATCKDAVKECVRAYREAMTEFAQMTFLDVWYASLEVKDILSRATSAMRKVVEARIAKETTRSAAEHDFPKLVSVDDGRPVIRDNAPLIYHAQAQQQKGFDQTVKQAFAKYRETLQENRAILLDRFRLMDIAIKVVGVGSVGTRCGIMLLMGGPKDVLFLQVKEARTSVLEPFAGKSHYPNRGQRIVAGQRLMQSASDAFLGWTDGVQGRHFYVRQLRDVKLKPEIELMRPTNFVAYAKHCGWVLARAHARSGQPALISGYVGRSDRFDKAVTAFSVAYADQNERDHKALADAVRKGTVQAYMER